MLSKAENVTTYTMITHIYIANSLAKEVSKDQPNTSSLSHISHTPPPSSFSENMKRYSSSIRSKEESDVPNIHYDGVNISDLCNMINWIHRDHSSISGGDYREFKVLVGKLNVLCNKLKNTTNSVYSEEKCDSRVASTPVFNKSDAVK